MAEKTYEENQRDLQAVNDWNRSQAEMFGQRAAQQSTLDRFLGVISTPEQLITKGLYNLGSAMSGREGVSWSPKYRVEHTDLARLDAQIAGRPYEEMFPFTSKNETAMNLATGIAGDPLNLLTGGATAIGKAANVARGLGIATKADEAGRIALTAIKDIDTLDKATGATKTLFKAGDVFSHADLAKALPDAAKALQKAGVVDGAGKVMRDLGAAGGVAEQIRRGERGMKFGGLTIGGQRGQAAAVDKVAKHWDTLMASSPRLKSWLSRPSTKIDELNELVPGAGDALSGATNLGYNERLAARQSKEMAKKIQSFLPEFYRARAARAGTTVEEAMAGADKNGLTKELESLLHLNQQVPETAAEMAAQKGTRGRALHASPGGKDFSIAETLRPLDEGLAEDAAPILDHLKQTTFQENRARTGRLVQAGEDATHFDPQIAILSDYAKSVSKGNMTTEAADDAIRKSNLLSSINAKIAGARRIFRGGTTQDANLLQNVRANVLGSDAFTLAEKVAALVLKDIRHVPNKVGDLVDLGRRKDIDRLIATAADADTADALKTTKELTEDIRKALGAASPGGMTKAQMRDLYAKVKKVDLQALVDKAKDMGVRDFYHYGVPVTEYVSKMEVLQRTKAIEFVDKLLSGGLANHTIEMVKDGDQAPIGYVKLKDVMFADVPPRVVQAAMGPDAQGSYKYAMRQDMYDLLKEQKVFRIMADPLNPETQSAIEASLAAYDKTISLWKSINLGLSPAYYARNLIDDTLKMVFEGSAQDLDARAKAIQAWGRHGDLAVYQKMAGNAEPWSIKAAGGQVLSDEQVMKEFLGQSVMGSGLTEAGVMRDRESLEQLLKRRGILSGDKIEAAKQLDGFIARAGRVAGETGEKVYDAIRKIMNVQESMEAMNRMTTYIHHRRTMSAADAAKRTKLAHFDYENASQFERQVLQRLFPFYQFKSGITRYLANNLMDSNMKMRLALSIPRFANTILNPDDEQVNPGFLPEYLRDAFIQLGTDDKGEPRVVNLRGLSSFAEVVDFIKPTGLMTSFLSPILKAPLEMVANKDLYFDKPVERYEGQKKNVLGFQVERLGLPMQVAKNLRPIGFVTDGMESLLKNSDVSVFGTKEKKGLFGKGSTDATFRSKPFSEFLAGKIAGIPITHIDVERQRQNSAYEIKDILRKHKAAVRGIKQDYKRDPETSAKEIQARVKLFTDRLNAVNARNPYSPFKKQASRQGVSNDVQ